MDRRANRSSAWSRAAVLLVASAALTPSAQAGKRIAPVGALCPADAPKKHIDADGVKDVCVASAPVTCASGRLVEDASGPGDRCVADGPAGKPASEKPSCPSGFDLRAVPGPDSCVRVAHPVCTGGFHLSPKAKEDFCEY